ncbi:MAG: hypothetical protein VB111_02335 [Clostridiaceae bacterium]|nr:hypothetical protein [Clostridiaceae bacterium]
MAEKVCPGPVHSSACVKEAVCIHTKKIYDSCRVKECMQDLRVYLTKRSQEVLERAVSVRPRSVDLLWVYIDVEPVPYNRGFYNLDVRFFYRVCADAFCGAGRPYELNGVTSYEKRVILFGGEGCVRSFSSLYTPGDTDIQMMEKTNLPQATCEVVDPMLLNAKAVEHCGCRDCEISELPEAVCKFFNDELLLACDGKQLYVTIGQFGIIRLERDSQLLIPSYDYCLPMKECSCSEHDDPCETFSCISFPVNEFFPGAENSQGS